MSNDNPSSRASVEAMLSGYIDGELTQQERQRVEVLCASDPDLAKTLEELRSLRKKVGQSRLSELGEDIWRENMNDSKVRTTRNIGWLLLIGGLLVMGGMAIFAYILDSTVPLGIKLLTFAIYGGLAVLFVSVLWQRLVERKTDKYKDVEI